MDCLVKFIVSPGKICYKRKISNNVIPLIFRPLFCNFYIKFLYFFNILNSHWQLHKFRIKSLRYSRGRVGAPYFLSNGNWRAEKSGKSQRLKDSKQLMTAALDILTDDIGQGFSMIASVLCLLKKKKKMIRISKLYLLSTIDLYAQDWPPSLPPNNCSTGWVTK